jgi:hypothetical protein
MGMISTGGGDGLEIFAAGTGTVDARSALFDLYGDHLRTRGAQAPAASRFVDCCLRADLPGPA